MICEGKQLYFHDGVIERAVTGIGNSITFYVIIGLVLIAIHMVLEDILIWIILAMKTNTCYLLGTVAMETNFSACFNQSSTFPTEQQINLIEWKYFKERPFKCPCLHG